LTIKALWNITTDKNKYKPGETISEFDTKEETRLIKLGAAEKVIKKADKNA
jgi:hypothetical protein